MTNIKTEDLEKALNSNEEAPKISPEEEIGYHKGALNTLVKEREGLIQMIGIVESTLQAHLKRLEELGVKIPKK